MRRILLSALFFLAFFGIYLKALSPAYHPDDSPETITAGATLSIQHPPGYPLHSILGRLAVLVFPGSAAFRINLLSAILGVLGLLAFAWVVAYVDEAYGGQGRLEPALAIAALLGLTLTLWFQSEIAKGGIYALNFLLTELALLGLLAQLKAWRFGSAATGGLKVCALSFGLGMANHWTSQVVLLPGFGLLLFEPWNAAGRPWPLPKLVRQVVTLALLVGAGLSLYLFLPLRSLLHPVLEWGEPWTLSGFWWVFNRSQYASLEAHKSLAAFWSLLRHVGQDLELEYHSFGLLALGLGWLLLLRRRLWLSLSLLSIPVVLVLAVCVKANPPADSLWVIDPYLVPLYSGLALGFVGFAFLPELWSRFRALAFLLGALALGFWHWPMADQSQHYLAYDYVNNLLLSCPQNSLLFCEGDSNTAGPFFQHFVLGKRPDMSLIVDVLSDYEWYRQGLGLANSGLKLPPKPLGPPGNIDFMVQANQPRPSMLSNSFTKEWMDPQRLVPRGLVNRVLPRGQWPLTPAARLAAVQKNRIWDAYALRGVFAPALVSDPITKRLVTDNYVDCLAHLAEALQTAGRQDLAEKEFVKLGKLRRGWAAPWIQAGDAAFYQKALERAGSEWRRASEEDPKSAEAAANMGLYYFSVKNYELAVSAAQKALDIQPGMPNAKDILEKAQQQLQRPLAAPTRESGIEFAANGDALASKGDAVEALKSYDQALAAGYATAGVYRNRAVMFGRLNRPKDAQDALQKGVDLEPKNEELRKYLAVFKFNNGDQAGALKDVLECQRLAPTDQSLQSLISQIQAGQKH